jgi:putative peptide maturation dehydrogenase
VNEAALMAPAAMGSQVVRLRRRRYFLLRIGDETTLDIARFLSGEISTKRNARCWLLCPITGRDLPITADELQLVMTLPVESWLECKASQGGDSEDAVRMVDLARRGIVVSDPSADGWEHLAMGEQTLEQAHWLDLAAVYHAHTRWQGVLGVAPQSKADIHEQLENLDSWRRACGDPPPHFVERSDSRGRIALRAPVLSGVFFDTLIARRTTRAFRTDEPLPRSALEQMLHVVFGAHGIKHLVPGVVAIKRTSPSGGGLHPIEAYVLALHVEGVPSGLYHYEAASHCLAELERMDTASARSLASAFMAGQAYFAQAHALVIHVARFDRTFWKYVQHRKAYGVVLMDSGHLSQTFYLTATHLGLGAFYTAAINDADIAERLRLPPGREAAIGINGVGIVLTGQDELHFVPDPYEPN